MTQIQHTVARQLHYGRAFCARRWVAVSALGYVGLSSLDLGLWRGLWGRWRGAPTYFQKWPRLGAVSELNVVHLVFIFNPVNMNTR